MFPIISKKIIIPMLVLSLALVVASQVNKYDMEAASPIDPPSDFSATDFTGTTATLHWTDNTIGEDHFNIYLSVNETLPGTSTYTAPADSTSLFASGLSDTNPNYLWIKADDGFGGETAAASMCLKYSEVYGHILPCDGAADDWFGYAVDIDGDYAVVGAYGNDDNGAESGSAYVFYKSDDHWVQQKKLIASDANAGDEFGFSVAIDGDYVVIGAPLNDDGGGNSGSAYIFYRNSGGTDNWGEQEKLIASDDSMNDEFGYSVDIDDEYAIIGAWHNDGIADWGGSAYIFERGGAVWSEIENLRASDEFEDYASFGNAVAINGSYAVIGAYREDGNEVDSGAAYVFARDFFGDWNEVKKLTASDGDSSDHFGNSVDVDGTNIVVGASGQNKATYLFNRDGVNPSNWGEFKKLGDQGLSSSITGDYVLTGDGAANMFKKDFDPDNVETPLSDNWGAQLGIRNNANSYDDRFAYDAALDDINMIAGAYWDDDSGNDSGSAFIYNYIDNVSWDFSYNGFRQCVSSTINDTRFYPYWIYPDEALALTDLTCGNSGPSAYITSVDGNGPEYLPNLTSLTFAPYVGSPVNYGVLNNISGMGSDNDNLDDFTSNNTITITNNDFLDVGVAEAALNEVAILEGAGATVIHNIDWEDCTNRIDDDDDGDVDSADLYCRTPDLYVDFDTGTDNTECTQTNPCGDLYWVITETSPWYTQAFRKLNARGDSSNINIHARGTNSSFDLVDFRWHHQAPRTYNTLTIKPWGNDTPVFDGASFYIYEPNTIVQGFDIRNNAVMYIYAYYGGPVTVKNNYIHDATGSYPLNAYGNDGIKIQNNYFANNQSVALYAPSDNVEISNNIFSNNRGGAGGTCGGAYIANPGNNSVIINNSFYNNCDAGNSSDYADINIDSNSGTNFIVKNNLVYNDLGGETYKYDVDGADINGVSAPGIIRNQTAADWGNDSNNFLETVTSPFEDAVSAIDWETAGAGFELAEPTDYKVTNLLSFDFLSRPRSMGGTGEAGALEYQDGDEGSSYVPPEDDDEDPETEPPCSPLPIKLNIRDTFIGQLDGDPVVTLRWREEGLQELNAGQKIQILFDYFDASPTVGNNNVKLKNIFTQHIYSELDKPANNICDDNEADSILSLIKGMASDPEVSGLIVEFINNLLALENTLVATGETVTTPFTNFYNQQYGNGSGGTLKVAREVSESGTFVADMMTDDLGPTAKSWTDTDILSSETQKQYRYQLITESCGETKYGNKTIVTIDPVVPPGTNVDVTLDLKIIVKEAYDMLIMNKFRKLFAEDGNQFVHNLTCEDIKAEFFEKKNSMLAFDYLTACFGEGDEVLIGEIIERENLIVPLLIEMIKGDMSQEDIEAKVQGIINDIKEEVSLRISTKTDVRELEINVGGFVNKTDIANLNEADEDLMKLIGEEYFGGVSHAADLVIEKYDADDNLLETFDTRTDIFGRTSINIGNFIAGDDYQLKIRLADERFVLPKIANIQINNATEEIRPFGTIYTADVNLRFDKPFRFGDFNEDDRINLSDLAAWGNLLRGQVPGEGNGYELYELWNFANLDGLQGIDLLDAVTLQQNWGGLKEFSIEESEVSLLELLELFGITVSTRPDLELVVKVATWVNYLGSSCR